CLGVEGPERLGGGDLELPEVALELGGQGGDDLGSALLEGAEGFDDRDADGGLGVLLQRLDQRGGDLLVADLAERLGRGPAPLPVRAGGGLADQVLHAGG